MCVCPCTLAPQVALARALLATKQPKAAEALLSSVFTNGYKSQGRESHVVLTALKEYWCLLPVEQGRVKEAAELRARAEKLRCNVAHCK